MIQYPLPKARLLFYRIGLAKPRGRSSTLMVAFTLWEPERRFPLSTPYRVIFTQTSDCIVTARGVPLPPSSLRRDGLSGLRIGSFQFSLRCFSCSACNTQSVRTAINQKELKSALNRALTIEFAHLKFDSLVTPVIKLELLISIQR